MGKTKPIITTIFTCFLIHFTALAHEPVVFKLDATVKQQFIRTTQHLKDDPYNNNSEHRKAVGEAAQKLLPKGLLKTLQKMGKEGSPGLLLIKGAPIDEVIPQDEALSDRLLHKTKVSENFMLAVMHLMGCAPHSNPKEQNGKIVHNVSPVKGFEKTQSSKGRDPFYLHIENPFEKNPPEFLMLTGLIGDETAQTTYFFVEDFLAQLPEWVKEGMTQPHFKIRSGSGFDNVEEGVYPLLDKKGDEVRLRFYESPERIQALNTEAQKVLDYLIAAFKVYLPAKSVSLQPGEMIIFNNGWGKGKVTGIMHGRGGTVTNPLRWLQRAFLYREERLPTKQ